MALRLGVRSLRRPDARAAVEPLQVNLGRNPATIPCMLVFQFGSNTSAARLNSVERLRGAAIDFGLARTRDNYELTFAVWSKTNNCAAADLRAGGVSPAWGVLYEIPNYVVVKGRTSGRKTLDEIEGPRYDRRRVEIVFADGSTPKGPVITYRAREPESGLRTSLEYVGHILVGLYEHGAPTEYLNRVKQLIVANNSDLRDAMEQFRLGGNTESFEQTRTFPGS